MNKLKEVKPKLKFFEIIGYEIITTPKTLSLLTIGEDNNWTISFSSL